MQQQISVVWPNLSPSAWSDVIFLSLVFIISRAHKREEGMQVRNIKVQIGHGSYQK